MPITNGTPPIETNYLNPKNPDVRCHYNGYKLRHGIALWEPLTPEQVEEYELDFLARLPMFQAEREHMYPFFLDINRNNEVNEAYRKYFARNLLTDAGRDEFERQFAARKVGERRAVLEGT